MLKYYDGFKKKKTLCYSFRNLLHWTSPLTVAKTVFDKSLTHKARQATILAFRHMSTGHDRGPGICVYFMGVRWGLIHSNAPISPPECKRTNYFANDILLVTVMYFYLFQSFDCYNPGVSSLVERNDSTYPL